MPLDWLTILERTGSVQPNTAGWSMDGGKANMRLVVGENVLSEALLGLLGIAVPDMFRSDGQGGFLPASTGICRILPKAHPQWPWLFCDTVENIAGQQYQDAVDWEATNLGLVGAMEASPLPTYARYREYELQASFSPKQYTLATDEFLEANKVDVWYTRPDSLIQAFTMRPEWLRYLTVTKVPRVEMMSASQGTQVFMGKSGAFPNGDAAGAGQIKAMVPCADVTFVWHAVPYSFILGKGSANTPFGPPALGDGLSVFDFAGGTINQNAFLGFPAGTLLFMGAEPTNIRPVPFPEISLAFNMGGAKYLWSNSRICDIEMKFMYRNPKSPFTYPKSGEEGNRVYAGHNLMLNAQDGQYYPVFWSKYWDTGNPGPAPPATPKRNTKPFPPTTGMGLTYNSFAHELLFSNPDYTVPILIL